MTKVETLEAQVATLTEDELRRLRAKLDELIADWVDRRLEADVLAGRFDELAAQARRDVEAGRYEEL